MDLHEANKKLQAGGGKPGTDATQERRQLEEQRRQLEEQRRQTEERAKSIDQKYRTLEEKERTLQSLDQDLKKRKAKMDQLEQQLQKVRSPVSARRQTPGTCVCFAERWSAGQKIGGNANDPGSNRKGIGKGKGGVNQKQCRDREIIAADANDSGGAKHEGETNPRSTRVS